MNRVKDITKVILRSDAILAKIVEIKSKSSNLILPGAEDSPSAIDYLEVINVGNKVEDILPGYIILDMSPVGYDIYVVGKEKYCIIFRNNVKVAIASDNFKPVDNVESLIIT